MKSRFAAALVACVLATFVLASNYAMAATTIYCIFRWDENVGLNVKSSADYMASRGREGERLYSERKVRTKEYNRLVCADASSTCWTPVRVAGDRGAFCNINHPENTRFDIRLRKSSLRRWDNSRIPNCADLNATVRCLGDLDSPLLLRTR